MKPYMVWQDNNKFLYFGLLSIFVVLMGALSLSILVFLSNNDKIDPPVIKNDAQSWLINVSEGSNFMEAASAMAEVDCSSHLRIMSDGKFLITEPGIPPPILIHDVLPKHPEEAIKNHIGGHVAVEVLVNEQGIVETARIMKSDNELFNEAALKAAKQWCFIPPKDACGNPVACYYLQKLVFSPTTEK